MKKVFIYLLMAVITISLFACSGKENKRVSSRESSRESSMISEIIPENYELLIRIGDKDFIASLVDNATTNAFIEMLPMTINMSDLNNNEKDYYLPKSLTTSASNPENIEVGDIMLYGSNCLVIFYKSFSTSYSYTKIGSIINPLDLKESVGIKDITIIISIK